ncbi:hypothetical protein BDZ91DRAFT_768772 [Kalaharituber pfeilii]|nr:hypothetical protein BDZ91DRAFT_768772 [Kalaharituber pfeilii]
MKTFKTFSCSINKLRGSTRSASMGPRHHIPGTTIFATPTGGFRVTFDVPELGTLNTPALSEEWNTTIAFIANTEVGVDTQSITAEASLPDTTSTYASMEEDGVTQRPYSQTTNAAAVQLDVPVPPSYHYTESNNSINSPPLGPLVGPIQRTFYSNSSLDKGKDKAARTLADNVNSNEQALQTGVFRRLWVWIKNLPGVKRFQLRQGGYNHKLHKNATCSDENAHLQSSDCADVNAGHTPRTEDKEEQFKKNNPSIQCRHATSKRQTILEFVNGTQSMNFDTCNSWPRNSVKHILRIT